MTGRTSDEVTDIPQESRSTDSESATKFPAIRSGVVQDSPGTSAVNTTDEGLLDDQGNYQEDDTNMLGTPTITEQKE